MIVVYTAGVWDQLHRGHLNLLWESKKLGDLLVVGVVTDRGANAYKGRFPVEPQLKRYSMIMHLSWVDVVMMQDGTDPTRNLRQIMPDIMTHGDDWQRLQEGHETLDKLGVQFVKLPYTPGISSTILRDGRA
jgi:cytidyltransferase-like protein